MIFTKNVCIFFGWGEGQDNIFFVRIIFCRADQLKRKSKINGAEEEKIYM